MTRRLIPLSILAGLGVGCAPAPDTPGITDETIRIGAIADMSGPAAFIGQDMKAGAELWFSHINEQGGVHGRTLELVAEDDGYQPPRTVAAYRKLVDRDRVFSLLYTMGTAPTLALKPVVEREQVPVFAGAFSSAITDPPARYMFGGGQTYRMQGWVLVDRILEHAPDARIGVLYQDDDMGLDGLEGVREAAAHYGVDVVAEEGHSRGVVDFSSQVLNLRRAGVTHIALFTLVRETAAIMREADQLGWVPEFIAFNVLSDDRVIELAGEAAANLHVLSVLDLESDDPGILRYLELIERYSPEQRPGPYNAFGYALAQILVEALERAGPDPTREALVTALETFDRWDENVLRLPVTYGPGMRGSRETRAFFSAADLESGRLVREGPDFTFALPGLND
jgi:branched-chain amino acid transport system substrate-binding protein